MNFWSEQYDPSAEELENASHETINQIKNEHHPNIVPLPSGKFRAYVTRHRAKVYLGTFNTLEQALEAQSPLNDAKTSLQRVKKKQVPLTSLVETFLTHYGEWEP